MSHVHLPSQQIKAERRLPPYWKLEIPSDKNATFVDLFLLAVAIALVAVVVIELLR